ncbi:MAG: hypothetical protein ACYS8Z_27150 [Planctomycetota bacterium]
MRQRGCGKKLSSDSRRLFWWRLALHCGKPHPDLLLAGLSYRQMREIEAYANIEAIGWDVGVSRPRTSEDSPETEEVEDKLDRILGSFEKR